MLPNLHPQSHTFYSLILTNCRIIQGESLDQEVTSKHRKPALCNVRDVWIPETARI